jgi:toxin YoeB
MLIWHDAAWADYLYWQGQDKKTLKRINQLIKDIERSPYEGIGKPEALRGNLSGFWSRRIDEQNRLVYRIQNEDCQIAQCKGHYRPDPKGQT